MSIAPSRMAQLGMIPPLIALAGLPLTEGRATGMLPVAQHHPRKNTASALLGNWLPYANAALQLPSAGAYVREGIPSVPPKLVDRIWPREFVEMGELLLEFWSSTKDDKTEWRETRACRRRKVMNIFTWLQCFLSYVAVLTSQELSTIPELIPYMGTIIRVSSGSARTMQSWQHLPYSHFFWRHWCP